MLNVEERKNKIRTHVAHLSDRFGEGLWNSTEKTLKIQRMKPSFMDEFDAKWKELDVRYKDYLDGKIEWDGETTQMEMLPISGVMFNRLEIERDIINYAREFYCWFQIQIKDL